jgi:hypothetical protein
MSQFLASSRLRPVASRAAHTAAHPMLYPVYVLRRDLMAVNVGGVISGSAVSSGQNSTLRRREPPEKGSGEFRPAVDRRVRQAATGRREIEGCRRGQLYSVHETISARSGPPLIPRGSCRSSSAARNCLRASKVLAHRPLDLYLIEQRPLGLLVADQLVPKLAHVHSRTARYKRRRLIDTRGQVSPEKVWPPPPLPDRSSCTSLGHAAASEQYQQLGRVRRPQCRSAAIAGDGRLDALADPRLASKRLADPQRDH